MKISTENCLEKKKWSGTTGGNCSQNSWKIPAKKFTINVTVNADFLKINKYFWRSITTALTGYIYEHVSRNNLFFPIPVKVRFL